MRWRFLMVAAALVAAGCDGTNETTDEQPVSGRFEVNVQVTGAENLEPMMEEIDRRGLVATVWLSAAELDEKCSYVGELAARGHEIAGKYPGSIEADTTYEAQKAELVAILEASERCAGRPISGFRATRFTSNEHTHRLLDEYGIDYMVRSNRQVLLSIYTYKPYRLEGYQFSVLPMPLAVYYGETSSLCDTAVSGEITPAELLLHEKAAIDHNLALGEPLVSEWHPEMTQPAASPCWSTFLGTLDHIQSKGDRAVVTTAKAIVELYPPTSVQPIAPH